MLISVEVSKSYDVLGMLMTSGWFRLYFLSLWIADLLRSQLADQSFKNPKQYAYFTVSGELSRTVPFPYVTSALVTWGYVGIYMFLSGDTRILFSRCDRMTELFYQDWKIDIRLLKLESCPDLSKSS